LKYIIGIDSGATSSEVLIYPLGNSRAIIKRYPPVNLSVLGFKESAKRLVHIIKDVSKKIGLENIANVAAGISGARDEKIRNKLSLAVKKSTGLKKVKILTDTEIAFASVYGTNDRNCGILIAGTGSILYYRGSGGKIKRIGGWGRHIGDEGSGYWIAREGLYSVTNYFDGRGRQTRLANVLKKEFGIDSQNIINKVYREGFEISKLARYVFDCAEAGDRISQEIVKKAAIKLLEHFTPLKNKKYRIALLGSLFSEEGLLEKHLKKSAGKKFGNVSIIKPKQKAVYGAIKIALNEF
jgi:N-acetylglucosamine kinase